MRIERIEDKEFKLTLTDDEADFIADASEIDFERSKQISDHIGDKVLFYMMDASQFPHSKKPPLEVRI